MKNLRLKFLALIAVGLLGFSTFALATPQPADDGIIKRLTGGRASKAVKVYKLVRYAEQGENAVPLASGEVVVWDTISDDGVTIDVTTTSADGAIAGICVTSFETADVAGPADNQEGRRNWGFIQVHGPALAYVNRGGGNNHAAGDPFITSEDSGAVTRFEAANATYLNGATTTTQNRSRSGGFFMDASTSSGDDRVDVFITLE